MTTIKISLPKNKFARIVHAVGEARYIDKRLFEKGIDNIVIPLVDWETKLLITVKDKK